MRGCWHWPLPLATVYDTRCWSGCDLWLYAFSSNLLLALLAPAMVLSFSLRAARVTCSGRGCLLAVCLDPLLLYSARMAAS